MQNKIIASALLFLSLIGLPFAFSGGGEEETFDLKVKLQKSTQEFTLEDLGISVWEEETEELAWHNPYAYINLFRQLASKEKYDFSWDEDLVEASIRDSFALDTPRHASFVVTEEGVILQEEIDAIKFDTPKLLSQVSSDYPDLKTYKIKEIDWEPITKKELDPFAEYLTRLLLSGFNVTLGTQTHNFPIQTKDLIFDSSDEGAEFHLSKDYENYLMDTLNDIISYPSEDLVILEADLSGLNKAVTEGHVNNGLQFNPYQTLSKLHEAVGSQSTEFIAHSDIVLGEVINKTGLDLGDLDLISTGMTNFEYSPGGRDFNVRRALNEFYNSIIIPVGGTFSFNDHLGPVTYSAGWKGSYAIFGGTELEIVPGGGICQVSTTVYRAAINAGLDITELRQHSMYIDYYDDYGDGLDATIFPGFQDLQFVNNTGGPILFEAYDDGFDAVVNFYGNDDGRVVTLDGPFTASNQSEEVMDNVGVLRYYELAWKKTILWSDGTEDVEWLVSTYNSGVPQYKTNQ